MSPFHDTLKLEVLRGVELKDKPFVVSELFIYETDLLPLTNRIVIPEGYRTDFASIPRFFWRVVGPPSGWYRDAAVVHDFLCDVEPKRCDHVIASEIFHDAMLDIIREMDVEPKERRKRLKQAMIMKWAVEYFGPKFEAPDWGGGHA